MIMENWKFSMFFRKIVRCVKLDQFEILYRALELGAAVLYFPDQCSGKMDGPCHVIVLVF